MRRESMQFYFDIGTILSPITEEARLRQSDCLYLQLLVGETDSWRGLRLVEDDVLALQEDVAEDGETDAVIRLDTTEALGVGNRSKVDEFSRNGVQVAIDDERKVGKIGGAGEDHAARRR